MRNILLFLIISLAVIFCNETVFSEDSPYCGIEPALYLAGHYNPEKLKCFVNPAESGIPCDEKRHFLRVETAASLKKMLAEFKKDNPGIRIFVRSSFRGFNDQKYIWNSKFDGTALVSGKNLSRVFKNHKDRSREILKYSSMPGTSRHHWGTDFDINSLYNEYYNSGEGRIIYQWLKKNAGRFGFCQPYTAGRAGGYSEERWHWSYRPLSEIFLQDYNTLYEKEIKKFIKSSGFSGIESSINNALEYVNDINRDCR
jgi:LAS superfamily LD-carboxypeptidase LdcB